MADKLTFASGATSSAIPRFDLIPRGALVSIAKRFELGIERHGPGAWNARSSQDALYDDEWVIARAAHAVDHATKLLAKLIGQLPDDGDDDAAAIAWAGICLIEAMKVKRASES